MRGLLADLGCAQDTVAVFEDNNGCIDWCNGELKHKRSKHIDLRVFHARGSVERGVMKVVKIGTDDQTADILTKAMRNRNKFEKLRTLIMGS